MADIVIRGMEMPEFCDECGCKRRTQRGACCGILGKPLKTSRNYKRDDECPLIPLPEGHGRLIDADAFKAMCLSATKEAKPDFIRHEDWLKSCAITMSFCRDIDEQPTIVPAEGGGEE